MKVLKTITRVRLEVADNGGYVIKYDMKITHQKGKFDGNTTWDDKTEVFTQDDRDAAMDRLDALAELERAQTGIDSEMTKTSTNE